jgi:hypothetical protein
LPEKATIFWIQRLIHFDDVFFTVSTRSACDKVLGNVVTTCK